MGSYTNPQCMGMAEFMEDMNRIKYIKRLFKKYTKSGKIRPILLLNHMMILGNVFGQRSASRMLFFKLEPDLYPQLKTTLLYLNAVEESIILDGLNLDTIPMDLRLAELLRKL